MKNIVKLFGIIALAVVIGFFVTSCPSEDTKDDPDIELQPFNDITAAELVSNIKVGWNLGNTLDATDYGEGWLPYTSTITQFETRWGNPVTTQENIDAIKNAGFNAIRIPVSWTKAVDAKYNIRGDWMKRVKEVVNYAVNNDMYIILDTHHDEHVFKFTNAEKTVSLEAFKKIWEQIADNFKNYNEKLIFEALNEPRNKDSPSEWAGGTPEERDVLNAYYPVFIDAVRNSGGNNDKRILMITPYAAVNGSDIPISKLVLPDDTVPNKLIVSIHAYSPWEFVQGRATLNINNDRWHIETGSRINEAYDKFVSKGIPVIIGEFAADAEHPSSQTQSQRDVDRVEYVKCYVGYARSKGIPCFWWDAGGENGDGDTIGGRIFNRKTNTFPYPEIIAALMDTANNTTPLPPGNDLLISNPELTAVGSSGVTVSGNRVTINSANANNHGFYYTLPNDLDSSFKNITVNIKVTSITKGNAKFTARNNAALSGDLVPDVTQWLNVGIEVDAENSATYPLSACTNGLIAFQHNTWDPAVNDNVNVNYTVEVTFRFTK